jgi:heme A synthase
MNLDRDWSWTLVRVVVVLQAADSFLEPVFAGRFLSGDFGMLKAHQHNATFGVFILSVLQIGTAVLAWRRGKGPRWLVVVASVLAGAVLLQIIMGFDRVLGVHIPLGVAIIVTLGWLAVWVLMHGGKVSERES